MSNAQLHERFRDMLPASLGEPYIVHTTKKPYLFIAFFEDKWHEMDNGTTMYGCEFRLWKPSPGINGSQSMGGIIGVNPETKAPRIAALTDCFTKAKDLKPYARMLVKIMVRIGRMHYSD